jgi:ABC-type uncharacterized transport system ATPase subunit
MSDPSLSARAASHEAIRLTGITKRFGAVIANDHVNLSVHKGEIHGIIGENGAGKSTLMSILYGFYHADEGEIQVDGVPVKIQSSDHAIRLGIGMVHQHFMLVSTFTVLENIMLGAEGSWSIKQGAAQARTALKALSKQYGLQVDPDALISDLSVGEQQRVEILKALYRKADILILDEPTGVLTPQEVDQLFSILRTLKAEGLAVLLITHKLQEVLSITDRVTVMRQGKQVAVTETATTSREALAELMVGRKVLLSVDKTPCHPGKVLLDAQGLSLKDSKGVQRLDSISFQLHSGEIVGIAGVSGNGQTELLNLLSGITPIQEGYLILANQQIDAKRALTPDQFRALGVGHVAEDRHRMGMVGAFEARETALMGVQDQARFRRFGLLNGKAITQHCKRLMDEFDVRPADPSLKTALFSGGNQQKLCIAREVDASPSVLLVGQPTRGVDIGAIEFIHKRLVQLRDEGAAVLVVSVELEEIVSLCDRILVMSEGRLVGEVDAAEADLCSLGMMMGQSRTPENEDHILAAASEGIES